MKKISVKYFSNYKSFTFPCLIYALNLSVFWSKIAQKDKKLLKATITAKSWSKGQVAKTGLSRTLLQARGRGLLKNIWVGCAAWTMGSLAYKRIGDKIFETLYSNRVTSENKESTSFPCPLRSKLGFLLFSKGSSNSGTTLLGGDGGEKLYFPLLKSGNRQKAPLGRSVSTHFVANCKSVVNFATLY